MKDATAGKSFLEDIECTIRRSKININTLFAFYFLFILFSAIISFRFAFCLDSLSSRVTELETKMQQQESLTKEALGVDHKERIQAVYDGKHINY